MKLIKPSEISGRILSLLDESDQWVLIVSPYMKISKWYKLINRLDALKSKEITIEIYVRDHPENENTYRDLRKQNLDYIKIPNLHSKFYMNEKQGISSSMNLLLTSELNSLEMGYITESREDYNDMYDYYHRYIRNGEPVIRDTLAGQPFADIKELMRKTLKANYNNMKTIWLWMEEEALHIRTGRNNYRLTILDGILVITAKLRVASALTIGGGNRSKAELSLANTVGANKPKQHIHKSLVTKKVGDLSAMKVKVLNCYPPDLIELRGQAKYLLQSPCITRILESEATIIIEAVKRFLNVTDNLIL